MQLMQLLVKAVNNKVDASRGSGGHARLNLKQSNFFACGFDVSSSYICTDVKVLTPVVQANTTCAVMPNLNECGSDEVTSTVSILVAKDLLLFSGMRRSWDFLLSCQNSGLNVDVERLGSGKPPVCLTDNT